MQQPFFPAAHGAMTGCVTGQRNHQNIRFAIVQGAHGLEAEPVLAALALELPIGTCASIDR